MKFTLFSIFSLSFFLSNTLFAQSITDGANAIVHYKDYIFEIESPAKAIEKFKEKITVLDASGDNNYIYKRYDKHSKITEMKVTIFDKDGKEIEVIKKSDFQDQSAIGGGSLYEDARVKVYEFEQGTPFTYEFEYEKEHYGWRYIPENNFQDYNQSVIRCSYKLIFPPSIQVKYKTSHDSLLTFRELAQGDKKVYFWEAKNLKPSKKEPFSVDNSEILPSVQCAPSIFEYDNFRGSQSSWRDFGKFWTELNSNRLTISPELAQKVVQLTANISDRKEKIRVLYQYLQENYRYISVQLGIGGWQTYEASYVEKNKFGDCKALTNFMQALLKIAKIDGQPVAVSAGSEDFFNPSDDFVSMGFNHVILYIHSENMWLECVSRSNPAGYLGDFTAGRKGLVYWGNYSKLIDIPAIPIENNTIQKNVSVLMSAQGEAKIGISAKYSGIKQEDIRIRKVEMSAAEFDQYIRKNTPLNFSTIENYDLTMNPSEPELEIVYTGIANSFGSKSGSRLFVPVFSGVSFKNQLPENKNRQHPLLLHETFMENDTVSVQLPEGYKIENLPNALKLETDFGSVQTEILQNGNNLMAVFSLKILPVSVAANRYGEARDFYKKVEGALGGKAVLVRL